MSSNLIRGTNLYIILGCGRTGSNYLRDWLSDPIDERDGSEYNRPGGILNAIGTSEDNLKGFQRCRQVCSNVVIHTHNKNILSTLDIQPQDITLILSKRRDMFAVCMSHMTARVTKEWHHYTNKPITPVSINPALFSKFVYNILRWYSDIDLKLPYKKIHTIYFEDVLSDGRAFLMNQFEIEHELGTVNRYGFPPCPYNYKQWIINWMELREMFDRIAGVAQ